LQRCLWVIWAARQQVAQGAYSNWPATIGQHCVDGRRELEKTDAETSARQKRPIHLYAGMIVGVVKVEIRHLCVVSNNNSAQYL
jgi:hypothetical protein